MELFFLSLSVYFWSWESNCLLYFIEEKSETPLQTVSLFIVIELELKLKSPDLSPVFLVAQVAFYNEQDRNN